MTSPTERQLRELFAADAAGAPSATGLADLTIRRVRHRRRVRAAAASTLVAAVAVVGGPLPRVPDQLRRASAPGRGQVVQG